MTARERLVPDETHPITIEPTGQRVVVTRGGRPVATTDRALTLREASYPAVQYVPIVDVDQAVLEPTEHATYCPFKGDASYFSLVIDGERADNAVWTYEQPYDAVAQIAGHVAFYADQVDIAVG